MKTTENQVKRVEIVFYPPTRTKGDRIRIKGINNKYIAYDYKFNSALDMGLSILGGYNIVAVIPTERGGIVFIEEPVYSLEDDEVDVFSL
jgi:hypothetical protein